MFPNCAIRSGLRWERRAEVSRLLEALQQIHDNRAAEPFEAAAEGKGDPA